MYQASKILIATPLTSFRKKTTPTKEEAKEGSSEGEQEGSKNEHVMSIVPSIPLLEDVAEATYEGSAIKIILSFHSKFWLDDALLFFCSDSIVSQVWADPPRPSYAASSSSSSSSSPPCHLLTGFITGSHATAASKWSTWRIIDTFNKQLDLMFGTKEVPSP